MMGWLRTSVFVLAVTTCLWACHSGPGRRAATAQADSPAAAPDSLPPYTFQTPAGWSIETHFFPLDFAPEIPFAGVADVRFPPGWIHPGSNQFWAYLELWHLLGRPKLDTATLRSTIERYYTGLARLNPKDRTRGPLTPVIISRAQVTKVKTDSPDIATFEAGANAYDRFATMSGIDLRFRIHVDTCRHAGTVVFWEIAPKPYSNPIWNTMDSLWRNVGIAH